MTNRGNALGAGSLLTVEAAAERLGTSPRFIRRLIALRRADGPDSGAACRLPA
jgi:excisionase family DNA binding protein